MSVNKIAVASTEANAAIARVQTDQWKGLARFQSGLKGRGFAAMKQISFWYSKEEPSKPKHFKDGVSE